MSTTKELKICGLCDNNTSKYCCPKCEVFYCSLDCYKSEKHLECSENFYKDCVNEELTSNYADEESKQKMIDILKRLHEGDVESSDEIEGLMNSLEESEGDSDDGEDINLEERLKDLDLNNADAVWDVLTEDERNEFKAILSQGDVGDIIPQWEPWWLYKKQEGLVEDMEKCDKEEVEALSRCPLLKQSPKFETLTTVQPSDTINYNIINVIAAYTFMMRYLNGEPEAVEGSVYMLDICANLDTNTNFEELPIAVESVAQKCLQSELLETDKESLDVMKHDTYLVIQGPSPDMETYYCKAALSHLCQILTDAKSALKDKKNATKPKSTFSLKFPEHTSNLASKLDVNKLKKSIKKVEYYLSFLESYGMDLD